MKKETWCGKRKEVWSHTHTHVRTYAHGKCVLMRDTLEKAQQNRAGQVQTIKLCMESQIAGLSVCVCVDTSYSRCGDI